jgi:Ala-tRNA(Pro) deacylase
VSVRISTSTRISPLLPGSDGLSRWKEADSTNRVSALFFHSLCLGRTDVQGERGGCAIDIYQFLDENGIKYERQDHPAVFTVEEARRLVPPLPGAKTKNLFLRDRKGRRHFLVVVGYGKAVDLKALTALLGVSKLGFASPERLQRYLGVTPGAVSIMGVVNDSRREVEVIVDRDLWDARAFQCHPLVNTSTLVISRDHLQRFLDATGHQVRVLDVPSRD